MENISHRVIRLAIVALCLMLIPALGVFTAHKVEVKLDSLLVNAVSKKVGRSTEEIGGTGLKLSAICHNPNVSSTSWCSDFRGVDRLKTGSAFTLLIGFTIILAIMMARRYAGFDRRRLSKVFLPLVIAAIFIATLSTMAQGAIVIYSVYISGVVYFEQYSPKLLLLLSFGAIVPALILIKVIAKAIKEPPIFVEGEIVTENSAPGLFLLINKLANEIGTEKPDNVVVGLAPDFYVTAAKVQLTNQKLALCGTTLYLSLPFISILSKNEIGAVIGHELAHFKGEDVEYSKHFYPAYLRLNSAIEALKQESGYLYIVATFAYPALSTLNFIYDEFSRGRLEKPHGVSPGKIVAM